MGDMTPSAGDNLAAPRRRFFLQAAALAGGGLVLGIPLAPASAQAPLPQGVPPPPADFTLRPNAFIAIAPDGRVTLTIPQEEMGQGVYTSLSQLLADELDVPFDRITATPAQPDDSLYGAPATHRMGTGGSRSIRNFYTPLRLVGAAARLMLVQAAAQRWSTDPATLRTGEGDVIDPQGRRLSYGDLAQEAARLPVPRNPVLKPDSALTLIGRSVPRLDIPAKTNGSAQYGIDVQLPGLRVATLAACPVVGGRVAHVDDTALRGKPGLQVIVLDDIVAVAAANFWAAKQGLAALRITWDGGPDGLVDSATLWSELRAASTRQGAVALNQGDQSRAEGDKLEAAYELPFLSHAPMEPQNFTAHVKPDGTAELWGGSQVQTAAVEAAARTLKLPKEKITFHNFMLGGGFGRRLDTDMVVRACRIAQKVDGPVKVIWTREEDITQDVYRPAYRNTMSASLKGGRLTGWSHQITAGSVAVRMTGKPLADGVDRGALEGSIENNYAVPNFRVSFSESPPRAIRIGYWRGVAPNNNVFASESLMDEMAAKAGQDPVAFRLAHLDRVPRLKSILQRVAQLSGWGGALPPRVGRGVCAQFAFGSYIATVAEAEVDDTGRVRVRRMTSVIDAGRVVNPDGLLAQVQGGLIFGLTAALYGEITVAQGRVQQSNFNDYRMIRMNEAPAIDVHIADSLQAPGGIGEPGVTAAAPSLVNAIFAATGVRLRRLPIDRNALALRKTT